MDGTIIQFRGTIFEHGYGQVAKSVMQDRALNKHAKLVYAYICTFGTGAFPGYSKICNDLKIGRSTLSTAIKQLENNGYMTIESQRSSNGLFGKNVYVIEVIKKSLVSPPSTVDGLRPEDSNIYITR